MLFLKKPNETLFKRISRFGGGLHSAVHEKVTEFPAITLSSLVYDLRRVSTGLSVEKTQEYKYSQSQSIRSCLGLLLPMSQECF